VAALATRLGLGGHADAGAQGQQLLLKVLHQAQGGGVMLHGEMPGTQDLLPITEVQASHASMVVVAHLQLGAEWDGLPATGTLACPPMPVGEHNVRGLEQKL